MRLRRGRPARRARAIGDEDARCAAAARPTPGRPTAPRRRSRAAAPRSERLVGRCPTGIASSSTRTIAALAPAIGTFASATARTIACIATPARHARPPQRREHRRAEPRRPERRAGPARREARDDDRARAPPRAGARAGRARRAPRRATASALRTTPQLASQKAAGEPRRATRPRSPAHASPNAAASGLPGARVRATASSERREPGHEARGEAPALAPRTPRPRRRGVRAQRPRRRRTRERRRADERLVAEARPRASPRPRAARRSACERASGSEHQERPGHRPPHGGGLDSATAAAQERRDGRDGRDEEPETRGSGARRRGGRARARRERRPAAATTSAAPSAARAACVPSGSAAKTTPAATSSARHGCASSPRTRATPRRAPRPRRPRREPRRGTPGPRPPRGRRPPETIGAAHGAGTPAEAVVALRSPFMVGGKPLPDATLRPPMARFIDELKRTHDCGELRAADEGQGRRPLRLGGELPRPRRLRLHRPARPRGHHPARLRPGALRPRRRCRAKAHELARALRSEWVIGVRGVVKSRGDNKNPKLADRRDRGARRRADRLQQERDAALRDRRRASTPSEEKRLQYRYLDLRRAPAAEDAARPPPHQPDDAALLRRQRLPRARDAGHGEVHAGRRAQLPRPVAHARRASSTRWPRARSSSSSSTWWRGSTGTSRS